MEQYVRTIDKIGEFLDTVQVTGIQEANQLLNCVAFLGKIQKGELVISQGIPQIPTGLEKLSANGKSSVEEEKSQ
jgi:hypothetical protein